MMDKLMLATGIVGIMTVGGMMMTMVSVNCPITIGSGDAATTIQSILDGIMPVSYTHLNFRKIPFYINAIYQMIRNDTGSQFRLTVFAEQMICNRSFAFTGMPHAVPVSYTHLDVYKRQAAFCTSLYRDIIKFSLYGI